MAQTQQPVQDLQVQMQALGRKAKAAARQLAQLDSAARNRCLLAMSAELQTREAAILAANEQDLQAARAAGLSAAMIDRLRLTPARMAGIRQALQELTALPDPVGRIEQDKTLPNGLRLRKVHVPIGVIGIIYEARPNVTVDAGAICLKAGNAVLLRGGSEAIRSNLALAEAMAAGGAKAGLPDGAVQLLPWTDRQAVSLLVKMNAYVDLVIPRGGEGLIRFVAENASVPVIKHYKGVCTIYVDRVFDEAQALSIIDNAKCQRPAVCNAVENVLLHRDIAATFAPKLAAMLAAKGVELRGDDAFRALVPAAKPATEEDWSTEYNDLILSLKVVSGLDEAMDFIAHYGSAHSDAILSCDEAACERFLREVDSATVYANASTRFTDGGQFGMGAEIGISTDRLHARGPMGLDELTSYKYTIVGSGQVRG